MSSYNKERSNRLYKSLNQNWVYKLSEAIFSPGGREELSQKIQITLDSAPDTKSFLDVGCGPRSWFDDFGVNAVGVDISHPYLVEYISTDNCGATASAVSLPFADASFDAVWSVGLLHHLTDSMYRESVSEFLRVCQPGGYIAIIDAVLPYSFWKYPLQTILRKLDRGRYVRPQERFEEMISEFGDWAIQRIMYGRTGLEVVYAYRTKE